jgi:hypothetical protein
MEEVFVYAEEGACTARCCTVRARGGLKQGDGSVWSVGYVQVKYDYYLTSHRYLQ